MNPYAALQIAQAFVQSTASIFGASAQNKAAKANAKNANDAYLNTLSALNLRGSQETDAATQTILQADRAARSADALARVSAGESGVSGASVDAVLSDISRQGLEAKTTTERNLAMTMDQIAQDKLGALATRNSRVAAVPGANPFLTGLQIAGAGLDAGTAYYQSLPKPGRN